MGYRDLLVGGIALIDSQLKDLQSRVTHKMFLNDGGVGTPNYKEVKRVAFVDQKQRQVRSFSGVVTVCSATVTFARPGVNVNENDRLVLADGTDAEIIGVGGYMDPVTKVVMYTEAYLG
jgi:hypothetical protein